MNILMVEPVKTRPVVVRATAEQSSILRAAYSESSVALPEKLECLSEKTGLTEKWIQAWFGRQRSKARKTGEPSSDSLSPAEIASFKSEYQDPVLSSTSAGVPEQVLPTANPKKPRTRKRKPYVPKIKPEQILDTSAKCAHGSPLLKQDGETVPTSSANVKKRMRVSTLPISIRPVPVATRVEIPAPMNGHDSYHTQSASTSNPAQNHYDSATRFTSNAFSSSYIESTPQRPAHQVPQQCFSQFSMAIQGGIPLLTNESDFNSQAQNLSIFTRFKNSLQPAVQDHSASVPLSQPVSFHYQYTHSQLPEPITPNQQEPYLEKCIKTPRHDRDMTPDVVIFSECNIFQLILFHLQLDLQYPEVCYSNRGDIANANENYSTLRADYDPHEMTTPPSHLPALDGDRYFRWLDPSFAPLKYLKVLEPFQARYGDGVYVEVERDVAVNRLLDDDLVEQDPFQAAMGLVFLSRNGLEWDFR